MAEFCLDCWNRINKRKDSPSEYIISKDLDLCEGCGKMKHIIIGKRRYYEYPNISVNLMFAMFEFFFTFPYRIYQYFKNKKAGK